MRSPLVAFQALFGLAPWPRPLCMGIRLAAAVYLCACGPNPMGPDAGRADSPQTGSQASAQGVLEALAGFDRVVKADVLFPDPKQRALYRELPVATHQGKRVYGFELMAQPGMQPNRHFHIVSAAVGPTTGTKDAGPTTLAGPNGAFNVYALHTADGRFEISVSDGNLLPDSVDLPLFDLTRAARALADRYAAMKHMP